MLAECRLSGLRGLLRMRIAATNADVWRLWRRGRRAAEAQHCAHLQAHGVHVGYCSACGVWVS